jgi:hypothetical protein
MMREERDSPVRNIYSANETNLYTIDDVCFVQVQKLVAKCFRALLFCCSPVIMTVATSSYLVINPSERNIHRDQSVGRALASNANIPGSKEQSFQLTRIDICSAGVGGRVFDWASHSSGTPHLRKSTA